jgi:hypothetical protein
MTSPQFMYFYKKINKKNNKTNKQKTLQQQNQTMIVNINSIKRYVNEKKKTKTKIITLCVRNY